MKKFIIILLILLKFIICWANQIFAAEENISARLIAMDSALKKAESILAAEKIAQETIQEKAKIREAVFMQTVQTSESLLSDFSLRAPLIESLNAAFTLPYLSYEEGEYPSGGGFFASLGEKIHQWADEISTNIQEWKKNSEPRLKLEYRAWFTSEAHKWTDSTSTTESRLTYPNDGTINVVGATFKLHPRVFVDFNYGSGKVKGTGTDTDWIAGFSGEFFQTLHDSDGEISFYETNLYLRPLEMEHPLDGLLASGKYPMALEEILDYIAFDFFSGYLFYRGDYKMTNGRWIIFNNVRVVETAFDGLNSSYKIRHQGVRIGARMIFASPHGVSLTIRSAYLPWMESKGYGWWNLRILNFEDDGGRGKGYDGEVYVSYAPPKIPGLNFGAGYRCMRLVNRGGLSHSDEEDIGPWDMNWDVAKSELKGPFVDLSYKF